MTKTENLQLPQWAAEDPIRREDFNAAFAALEEKVLTEAPEQSVVSGSYVGNGAASRTIQLPFAPKMAVVIGHILDNNVIQFMTDSYCMTLESNSSGGSGAYYYNYSSSPYYNLKLVGKTLVVNNATWHNKSGKTVQYFLFR